MAADVGVSPYWELSFDAQGDPDGRQRARWIEGVRKHGVTDLVVFAHGWNNDRSTAGALYRRFFAHFPARRRPASGTWGALAVDAVHRRADAGLRPGGRRHR